MLAGGRTLQVLLNEIRRELPYKTYWQPSSPHALMREIRIAFYQQMKPVSTACKGNRRTFTPIRPGRVSLSTPYSPNLIPAGVENFASCLARDQLAQGLSPRPGYYGASKRAVG